MKIAVTSNYDDELFDEYFVAHDVSKHNGEAMCTRLNQHKHAEHDPGYYTLVDDDYKLHTRDH